MLTAVYCLAVAICLLGLCIKGHRARTDKASVDEAIAKLREEFSQESPRILCFIVRSPSAMVSKDVQKFTWDLQSFESKDWQDNDIITLVKKRKTAS